MKRCPTCQRAYADDTLRFCLEDGTALTSDSAANSDATILMDSSSNEPPPTEILPIGLVPTVHAYDEGAPLRQAHPAPTARQQARPTLNEFQNLAAPATRQRSTSSVVAVTVVATIILLGLGGLGVWLFLRDKGGNGTAAGTETTRTSTTSNGAVTSSSNSPGSKNINTTSVVTSTPIPTPTPLTTSSTTTTATPTPATQSTDTSSARREVMEALNGWTQTMRNADLNGHMAYYASTLHTYYMQSNYSASRVRDNVAKAFSKYSAFDVRLSSIQIEVDPSGQSAIATFDKTFVFSGATNYSGSGLNRFWFEKIGGRWLITGEKDLKTYYVNNN